MTKTCLLCLFLQDPFQVMTRQFLCYYDISYFLLSLDIRLFSTLHETKLIISLQNIISWYVVITRNFHMVLKQEDQEIVSYIS